MQTSFAQIKENLNGVVQQVRSTIEEKIRKRDPSRSRGHHGDGVGHHPDVEVVEPADKKVRDST
jgi:hypothetical protein